MTKILRRFKRYRRNAGDRSTGSLRARAIPA
jgi:hypothetical protein